jgi:uncharacterized protein YlxW (UPF0749 family)
MGLVGAPTSFVRYVNESGENVQRTKWALGVVMAVFGLLITTQFRVTQQVPADPSQMRAEDVAVELKLTQDRLKAAEQDRDRYAAEVDKLKKAAASVAPAPQVDTTPMEMMAGSLELKGPGLIVTLSEESGGTVKAQVQDEDLWMVVNELLAAGAEGIAVNGQRITVLSGIRNVGQRVMIYQTLTAAPFEVAAIGDPSVMEAALKLRDGVVATLERYGIKTAIVKSESIRLPAFRSIPTFRFAKPGK